MHLAEQFLLPLHPQFVKLDYVTTSRGVAEVVGFMNRHGNEVEDGPLLVLLGQDGDSYIVPKTSCQKVDKAGKL